MNPILFYGVPSGCSFGSIVALEWLDQPYQLYRIDMLAPTLHTAEYHQINPNQATPAFRTSAGHFLSESMAILNHIAALGIDQKLGFKQGSYQFDQLNMVLAYLNTTFFNSFSPLWYIYEQNGLQDCHQEALRAYGNQNVIKAHQQLEKILGNNTWLLGEHKTVVDAYFFGIARWTDYHDVINRKDFPEVHRLYQQLESDPAIQFAHAIEHQQPANTTGKFSGHIDLSEIDTPKNENRSK